MKKISVLMAFLMLAGCASESNLQDHEQRALLDHHCLGGEVEANYNYTFFSTNADEMNKSTVDTVCHPVKAQSELEKDIRTGGYN